jgi:hypothetical protein
MQLCFASPRSSVALFVLFLLEVVPRHPSARIAPRLLDDALLAEEVGSFDGTFFVGRFEDDAIGRLRVKTRAFSRPRGGMNDVDDCAAATTVARASRITSMQL